MGVPMTARHFTWLPNAITISRILLAFVVCWAAVKGNWVLGFWVLYIALTTDFLDGLAAKKLNAITKLGTELDRFADMLISAGALIGLALSGLLSWWVILVAPFIAVFFAEDRFFWPKRGLWYRLRPLLSVGYLFAVWVYAVWMYLAQAYSWHWWYVAATILFIGTSAMLKKHRLRAWWEVNREKRRS